MRTKKLDTPVLTVGALREALKGLSAGQPIKFNLSCVTKQEHKHGVVRAARLDPDGLDGSLVIDLGSSDEPQ